MDGLVLLLLRLLYFLYIPFCIVQDSFTFLRIVFLWIAGTLSDGTLDSDSDSGLGLGLELELASF